MTSDAWRVTRLSPLLLFTSWLFAPGSLLLAGDAVAIGYNSEGVWTAVTYYNSSTPRGGKDYKNQKEAEEAAIRDLRRRGEIRAAKENILSSSDSTGFVAVGRGTIPGHGEVTLVRRGKSQVEADANAFAELNKDGATAEQKIVYRYFSYGTDSK